MGLLSDQVERALSATQHARDDDHVLIELVLRQNGFRMTDEQRRVFYKVSFESVRRTRQKFQEEGKYAPSPEVAKRRRLKSMVVEQRVPTTRPEKVPQLIEEPARAVSWMKEDDEDS